MIFILMNFIQVSGSKDYSNNPGFYERGGCYLPCQSLLGVGYTSCENIFIKTTGKWCSNIFNFSKWGLQTPQLSPWIHAEKREKDCHHLQIMFPWYTQFPLNFILSHHYTRTIKVKTKLVGGISIKSLREMTNWVRDSLTKICYRDEINLGKYWQLGRWRWKWVVGETKKKKNRTETAPNHGCDWYELFIWLISFVCLWTWGKVKKKERGRLISCPHVSGVKSSNESNWRG